MDELTKIGNGHPWSCVCEVCSEERWGGTKASDPEVLAAQRELTAMYRRMIDANIPIGVPPPPYSNWKIPEAVKMGPPTPGPTVRVTGRGVSLEIQVNDELDEEIVRLALKATERRRYGR